MAGLGRARRDCPALLAQGRTIEDQVSANIRRVFQVSEPDLVARGVAVDLLQMTKRIGPQCEAAEHKDLSGEKSLALDHVVGD